MLRITENVVSDISLSIVLDMIFFPSSILFLSYRKYLKGKKIYKPSTVSQVCITFSQVSQILTFLQ